METFIDRLNGIIDGLEESLDRTHIFILNVEHMRRLQKDGVSKDGLREAEKRVDEFLAKRRE